MAAPKGNKNAHRGRAWTDAIRRALAKYSRDCGDEKPGFAAGLDRIAMRMVRAAAEGDEEAFHIIAEKIGDRLEGKPKEHVELDITSRDPSDLTDEQLADIASGRSDGAAEAASSADEASGLH